MSMMYGVNAPSYCVAYTNIFPSKYKRGKSPNLTRRSGYNPPSYSYFKNYFCIQT